MNRKSQFWALMVSTAICCVSFPIPLGIFALRVKQRWIWYLVGASAASVVLVFIATATAPQVPRPAPETGTQMESTPFVTLSTLLLLLLWLAAIVVMFLKRADYENAYLREGKSLSLSTPAATQQLPPMPTVPKAVPPGPQGSGATPPSAGGFRLRSKQAGSGSQRGESPQGTPTVDINSIDQVGLEALGLSTEAAANVIARRNALGGFTSPIQVQAIDGLSPHEWARIRDRMTFGSATAAGPGHDAPTAGAAEAPGPPDDAGPPRGRIVDL